MIKFSLLFICSFVSIVFSGDVPSPSPPPVEELSCRDAFDLVFLLDASSSIGSDNFELIRQYVIRVVEGLNVGPDQTRVAVAQYNRDVDIPFFLRQTTAKADVISVVQNLPYRGVGTRTALGLRTVHNQVLQVYNGWRSQNGFPTIVIVVTDGRTQDRMDLPEAARLLKTKATRVIAVGIQDGAATETEFEQELNIIASAPSQDNTFLLDGFNALSDTTHLNTILNSVCAVAADVNECLDNNGGCAHICTNSYQDFTCSCRKGFTLQGSQACTDINECLVDNGGCNQICTNTEGGFECSCNEGFVIARRFFCVPDSCFNNNDCDQICNNVVGGDFFCSCNPGFVLNDDRRTCTDINECAVNNGGCSFNCTNTPGSYICGCAPGFGLRPDGKNCGLECYTCDRVTNNEECILSVCPPNELSCQTTVRVENGVTSISKQCKQTEACVNNFIQNPRSAWSPTQCNDINNQLSVCRCCCHAGRCNAPSDCSVSDELDIVCPDPNSVYELVPPINLECTDENYPIGSSCTVDCGQPGYAPINGVNQIDCVLNPGTADGTWHGVVARQCEDINECATNNGGCSHTCTNTNGSFICSCPDANPCQEQGADLFFILDSSSSVGEANFELMKRFVESIGQNYNIGQGEGQVRVGLVTFNRDTIKRFDLNSATSTEDFTQKVTDIVYAGRGTRTAKALDFVVRNCLSEANGRRSNEPLIVVVITDGRSQDHARIPAAAELLHTVATRVFVIGVTNRVNEEEISTIAGGNRHDYRIVEGFENLDDDLGNLIGNRICTEPEAQLVLTSDERNCDVDECLTNNGGCSETCTNTVGSFFCSCAENEVLLNDGRTCGPNRCLIDNGDCSDICIPLADNNRRCACRRQRVRIDETNCADVNECLDENGGCSHECEDTDPGYVCLCPEGMILGSDRETCERDSCLDQVAPLICSQVCTNILGGGYQCSCLPGYVQVEGTGNCTDINECDINNGGCQHECQNTLGGHNCLCPEGQELRGDGRTCGITCYSCQNVATNAECTNTISCDSSQDTCFATVRWNNNVRRITKGCQQREACINNMLQNNRRAGEGPTQCNNLNLTSKCECCCFESLCNEGVCPYDFELPTCPLFDAEFVSFTGQTENGVQAGGIAYVNCPEGYTFSAGESGVGRMRLNCELNFLNNTGEWDGAPEDLGTCLDIDECFNSTGGCVAPAICQNTVGSFECVCPDQPADYELIDGVICERDECSDPDQGGCSHNCTNTIGSYECFCPPRFSLLEDRLTCDFNECEDGNGGCHQICINTAGGSTCACNPGLEIGPDQYTCVDTNECDTNNGGCSQICTNQNPGFECSCNEGFYMADDGFTCLEDPCVIAACEHVCERVDGEAVCSCRSGFILVDGRTCQDINECDGNHGCEYNCTNLPGSFVCECPPGQGLRPDGRTCGLACYHCNGDKTNAECNARPRQVCTADAQSCENEVRTHGGVKSIFKGCKQTEACRNNFIQNPRQAFPPNQCSGNTENSVCRCCCSGHLCNFDERPCATADPCHVERAEVIVVADSSSSVKFDNFQKLKAFVKSLLLSFNLGENQVHAALLRYNRDVELQFGLSTINNAAEVANAVDDMPYDGSGTRTGKALQWVIDNLLVEGAGARPGVPDIVITITDGRSQDDVEPPSQRLREMGVLTFAVGVGNVVQEQLDQIGGAASRVFVAENFDVLSDVVLKDLQQASCFDNNECDTNNGGCSDNCINTRGSFYCTCNEGRVLLPDARTCAATEDVADPSVVHVDECATNNGGCAQLCEDTAESFRCACNPGYTLANDNRTCTETDECVERGCSHTCVDRRGSAFCECPEDHELGEDGLTCAPRPGPADCPEGWRALARSCLRENTERLNYEAAKAACIGMGGRLVTANDEGTRRIIAQVFNQGNQWIGLNDREVEGTWLNSDGSPFTFELGWAPNQPGFGDCAYINQRYFASSCLNTRPSICQLARVNGFAVFSNTWPNGAQGKIYFPTGATAVRLRFPTPIQRFSVWNAHVNGPVLNQEVIVEQTDIELSSGNGYAGFTIDMRERFPDREITVDPYNEGES